MREFDVVCIGIGPANLALAAALLEWEQAPRVLLIDAAREQGWHEGMQISGALMQIHFLKDLVSLRNAASELSIVNHLAQTSKLEPFINTGRSRLTRQEFADYIAWVENKLPFTKERGRVATSLQRVPGTTDIEIAISDEDGTEKVRTRTLSLAIGGDPKLPSWYNDEWQTHSSSYLMRKTELLPCREASYRVAVVGGGQSGAEIAADLLSSYPNCQVDLSTPDYSLRRSEDSPFMNESFDSRSWANFRDMSSGDRKLTLQSLRSTNYGVVHEQTLAELYEAAMVQREGKSRLTVLGHTRVIDAKHTSLIYDSMQGKFDAHYDAAFLATGYDRGTSSGTLANLLSRLRLDTEDESSNYMGGRSLSSHEVTSGVFTLGVDEDRFGIGDTLLSSIALRAGEVSFEMNELIGSAEKNSSSKPDYPPKTFQAMDTGAALKLMTQFPLAAFVTGTEKSSLVSDIPLAVLSQEGEPVRLFGHLDLNNPQVQGLKEEVTFLFSGPDSYISPKLFPGRHLPTWNYASVVGRGSARILTDRNAILEGMFAISRTGLAAGNYDGLCPEEELDRDDSRIDLLLPHIVAFEIVDPTLLCRFKLSQDKPQQHKEIALRRLAANTGTAYELLEELSDVK